MGDVKPGRESGLTDHFNPTIVVTGANERSKRLLLHRDLTVDRLPFIVGRQSFRDPISTAFQDLGLADRKPYRISRNHFAIDRAGAFLIVCDKRSRIGTRVNGRLIGRKVSKDRIAFLHQGRNEIVLGGSISPYIFHVEVR